MRIVKTVAILSVAALTAGSLIWRTRHLGREHATSDRSVETAKNPSTGSKIETKTEQSSPGPIKLSETVQTIIGKRPGTMAERFQALTQLNKQLSRSECEALFAFLKEPIAPEELNRTVAFKNDVLHALRGQAELPEAWHKMLIELIEDRSLHPVMRDYSLQHLFTWYEESASAGRMFPGRAEMEQVFWQSLVETDGSMAGTAVLGLCYISQTNSDLDANRLRDEALRLIASDSGQSEASRISALQVCAMMKISDALVRGKTIASSNGSIPLRASAIAMIGALGESKDLEFLKQLESEKSAPLENVLSSAIERLSHRIKG